MDHLDQLENRSVHILREAYANFKNLCMLWSIGKDSTVLLWLARKAFFGHVPFPLIHIDTAYKIPEMIEYRDRLAMEWKLTMIYGQNRQALEEKRTFPDGAVDRIACCRRSRPTRSSTRSAASGRATGSTTRRASTSWTGTPRRSPASSSARARTRRGAARRSATSRPRNAQYHWDVGDQPPEFWNQFKTDFAPGTHLRIHPLLDWTELNIWEYIKRENIPTVSLYYNQGDGKRYRSLGCWPCTQAVELGRPGTWTTSSWSCRPGSSPTSPSGRAGRRTRPTAAGWRPCGATGTCRPPCSPSGPSTPSRRCSRWPITSAASRCGSPTWPSEEQIPPKFLELILLGLKNQGILQSRKGKGGGYLLARDPSRHLPGPDRPDVRWPARPRALRQPDRLRRLRRLPRRGGVRGPPGHEGGPGRDREGAGRDQPCLPPPADGRRAPPDRHPTDNSCTPRGSSWHVYCLFTRSSRSSK